MEYGITLVSLVVTLIVLLILSGVTITSIVGNGGLMSKAQDISTSTKRIQIVSNLKTDILTEQLDGDITKGQLEEILTEYGEVQYDDDGDITGVYVDDIDDVIDIDEIFTGTLAEEITDTTAPTITIELGSTSAEINTAITATVTHTDSESGVDIANCKYIYNTTSGTLGTTNSSWNTATSFSSNPQTLSLSASALGTYYLHVLATDLSGNTAEVVSEAITITDTTAPTATIVLASVTSSTSGITTKATVTHTDNESGVDITNCKYIYNTSSDEIGTTSTSWTSASSFSSNSQTLSLTSTSLGCYLHVLTVDLAGNEAETIAATIALGDYVDYTSGTVSYTSTSTENGYGDCEFSDYTGTWQVLGVNETTGKILIISSSSVGTLYLKGQTGYANCEEELEYIGSLYANGTGADSGRSITVEDINKITGYDPDDAQYLSGTSYTYQWGNEVTYTRSSTTTITYVGTKYPMTAASASYSSFTYYTGTGWVSLGVGKSATFTQDAYSYDPTTVSTAEKSLLFNEEYWLGTRALSTESGRLSYSAYYADGGFRT